MSFELKCFRDLDINDSFFDSLREDYDDFDGWFEKKSKTSEKAYVSINESQIQAFLYVKDEETESVGDLPSEARMKIGTFKIAASSEGRRLGEGAVGIALRRWQRSPLDEIYLTVYPKHVDLITVIESFGFINKCNKDQECVYIKDKRNLSYTDPKKSFPYVNPTFNRGGLIAIEEDLHDHMFPSSELKNIKKEMEDLAVSNGITKSYIATPIDNIVYRPGEIVFIYRKYNGPGSKQYNSTVTSFCTVTRTLWVKKNGKVLESKEKYREFVGNKTVYDDKELDEKYSKKNVLVIELLYNGFFGVGKNITCKDLRESGYFENYPYSQKYDRKEIIGILKMGGIDEDHIIVDKSRTCE